MQPPSCRHLRSWTRWKAYYLVQERQFLHLDRAHTGDPFWWDGPSPVPVEMCIWRCSSIARSLARIEFSACLGSGTPGGLGHTEKSLGRYSGWSGEGDRREKCRGNTNSSKLYEERERLTRLAFLRRWIFAGSDISRNVMRRIDCAR